MEVASASKFYLETPTGDIVPLTETGKAVNFRFPPGDPTSKIHFVIKYTGRGHILKNLGMQGSILVNGSPVYQEVPLTPWDSLEAAGHSARYHQAGVPQRMTTTVLKEEPAETEKTEEELPVALEAETGNASVPFPKDSSQPATIPFPEAPLKSEEEESTAVAPKTKKSKVAGFPVPNSVTPTSTILEQEKKEERAAAPEFPKEVKHASERPTTPITSNAFDGLFEDNFDTPRSKAKTAVWTGMAVAAVLLVASVAGLAVRSNSGESQSQISSKTSGKAEELSQRMSQPMGDEEPVFNKVQKNR